MPIVQESDSKSQDLLKFSEKVRPFRETKSEIINVDARGLIRSDSRYKQHKLVKMVSDGGSTRTFETWEKTPIDNSVRVDDQYYTITAGSAYRPDLIAQDTLRNRHYWWWIMYLNNIFDITQLTPGKTLLVRQPPTTPLARIRFQGV